MVTQLNQEPLLTVQAGAHDIVIESLRAGFAFGGGIVPPPVICIGCLCVSLCVSVSCASLCDSLCLYVLPICWAEQVVEDGAQRVQLLGCSIHDVGGDALELRSRDTTIRSNDIAHTGGGGIVVNVNDRDAFVSLRPSNVTVANNHLHHIGYLGMAYGVGVRALQRSNRSI